MKKKCFFFLSFWTLIVVFTGFYWYKFRNSKYLNYKRSIDHPSVNSVRDDLLIPTSSETNHNFLFYNQFKKYCNLPTLNSFDGFEGQFNDTYGLLGVITIFRHGDRGPLMSFLHEKRDINCSSFVTDRYREMENYVEMYKPEPLGMKLLPQTDFCSPGLLSKQGASQLIELGHGFKKSYEKYLNFSDIKTVKHVSANTTPYSRTIQSLYSFLFGLVGPKSFLNITLQKLSDVAFCFKYCRCEAAIRFEKWHKSDLNTRLEREFSLKNFSAGVNVLLGDKGNAKKTVLPSTVKDIMLQYVCHDQIPECSTDNPVCLNSSTILPLDDFLQREAHASATGEYLRKASVLRAYGLLNNIDQQIHSWINVSKKRKPKSLLNLPNFYFFSGHDLTLMYILASLRMYDGYLPVYASRLTFEILSKNNLQYFLRILWNGVDVTKQVCPNTSTYCNARFIMNHIRSEMKRYFQTEKFTEACES